MSTFTRLAVAACLAAIVAPTSAHAGISVAMAFTCEHPEQAPKDTLVLSGLWDILLDAGGVPSFGLLSLGSTGEGIGGSISLVPGVVVVRSVETDGWAVRMVVASAEGDVRFEGTLHSDGKRMCGIATYHGGQRFEMIAQKRPERTSMRRN